MSFQRILPYVGMTLMLSGAALNLGACAPEEQQNADQVLCNDEVFGNSFEDLSPVICRVGDLEITQNDLDLRYEELPRNMKARFSGKDWEKRFLRYMVDEAIMYKAALERRIYLNPEVAQHLISQRRSVLKSALRDLDLIKDVKPTDEQIRNYYDLNREQFTKLGAMNARHIACQSEMHALEAYDRIRQGGSLGHFARVVADYSTNFESAKAAGDLGWFNRGGFIPALPYGKQFSEMIWDWDIGLHEPVEIGGEWHVIEILARDYERPLTLEEARDRIIMDLTPRIQEEAVEAFLRDAQQATAIEYFGAYRPGEGLDPKELFERAWYAKTPEQQIDLYKILIEDFPDSDLKDDALFMLANVYLDNWSDIPYASRYLNQLMREHPESELYEQAEYILTNMGKKDFRMPQSIEELRKLNSGN